MGVFGRGDHDGVARADKLAQRFDRFGLGLILDVVVGIERGKPGEVAIDEHADAAGREPRQRV